MQAFFPDGLRRERDAPCTHAKIAFNPTFYSMAARASFSADRIAHATLAEVLKALDLAGRTLPVASHAVAARIFAHNADCFRLVRESDFARSPMMAYLPLNSRGTAALIDGRFNGLDPALDHICRRGERADSIYLWLVYTPGRMNSGLRLLLELERIGQGAPIFTRPAHDASARILARSGFLATRELFPSAPEWLVVALPEARTPSAALASTATIRVARTVDDLLKVFAVRTATYMGEQLASYGEEFDGNDLCATHLIAEIDGEPAGCVRLRFFSDFAKLERLAVKSEYRRSRLMFRLVRAAFDHCRKKGYRLLYAHAREDLVPAWQRFGAKLVEGRPAFRFSDICFREMYLEVEPHQDAITFGTDPMIMIRPEGEWDMLGPIDRAQLLGTAGRGAAIDARVRRMKTG